MKEIFEKFRRASEMSMKAAVIVRDLASKVPASKRGKWYAGITNDLKRRFSDTEHNVDSEPCHSEEALTEEVAIRVEKELHEMGFKGAMQPGNTNEETTTVYIFRMSKTTDPSG